MFKASFGAAAVLAAVSLAQNANAHAIVFEDNFNTEAHGLNHTTFTNWTVTAGAVDVLGSHFFDLFPGNGNYVDLDGSTRGGPPAGQLTSKTSFGAGNYILNFMLGGNARGASAKTTEIDFGSFHTQITLAANAPLTPETFQFDNFAPGVHLVFTELGKADFRGNILDNVVLKEDAITPIPEMSTWAMMIVGFGLVGMQLRRSSGSRRFNAAS